MAIRSEKDPKIIKEMTEDQKRIRREWAKKQIGNYTKEEYERIMRDMSAGFIKAFSK